MTKIEIVVRTVENETISNEKVVAELYGIENRIEINQSVLSYPGLEIYLDHRRVFKEGQEVHLSRYEYGVLSFMAQHPGQLFTKEQIFAAVWHHDSESCLTAVTNTIGRIRKKIKDDANAPVYIRTISNIGYQFIPKDSTTESQTG